jgi:uncharacterized membrane-anchored protein
MCDSPIRTSALSLRAAPIIIATLFVTSLACAQNALPEAASDEISQMNWISVGAIRLGGSTSTITLPLGFAGIAGLEAGRAYELSQGRRNETVEAVIVHPADGGEVQFQWYPAGYVTADDWSDVDANAMIAEIRGNTETANADRRTHGLEELHVIGWMQQPVFDSATHTVFWAIGARSDSGPLVNAIALRLGRSGYEKLTWIGAPEAYKAVGGDLDIMLRAHSFDVGQRYEDHISTDRVAGYGIAALVGAVAGAKALKVAAAGGLILLLKKFWFLAFAAVVLFFKKIKRAIFPSKGPSTATTSAERPAEPRL